jgi:hypothetical protein
MSNLIAKFFRISEITNKYLEELVVKTGYSMTAILREAIYRMWKDEVGGR